MQTVKWLAAATCCWLIGCSGDTPRSNESVGYHAPGDSPSVATSEDADVSYTNPNTGTKSDYSLDVDKNPDGSVDRINFSNGGYIGENHIREQRDNGDGTITVITDRGYEYTVPGKIDRGD